VGMCPCTTPLIFVSVGVLVES